MLIVATLSVCNTKGQHTHFGHCHFTAHIELLLSFDLIFGSSVSWELYKPLGLFSAIFATNFEACDWSKHYIQLFCDWLAIMRPGWHQVAVQYSTADDMYTDCTVLFSLDQAHFAKKINSVLNTYGQILMPVAKHSFLHQALQLPVQLTDNSCLSHLSN
jgi:hypothetical protein